MTEPGYIDTGRKRRVENRVALVRLDGAIIDGEGDRLHY
jgi:hypothetical protein